MNNNNKSNGTIEDTSRDFDLSGEESSQGDVEFSLSIEPNSLSVHIADPGISDRLLI